MSPAGKTTRSALALAAAVAAVLVAWLLLASGGTTSARVQTLTPSVRMPGDVNSAQSGRAGSLRQLSPAQLAGQRVVYAYSGLRPPRSLFSVIRAGEAGGVILFGPNISSRSQIKAVIAQLQRAALAGPLHERLLILADQEGGEVRRLPGAPVLSEKQIGAAGGSVALAGAAGTGAGENLSAAGVNVNLAPVLDVYRQPGDFIDEFGRSYSSRPAIVASLAARFIVAQQRTGVSATAKHFPGLGAAPATQNTDLGPVRLSSSLPTLRSVDEAPYRSAIAAGVRLVMTSWATYPALDPSRPAGLSPAVIDGELRARLGFRGVTITDGIDAGAVTPFGNLATRSLMAAGAGADLILCATTNPNHNTPQEGIAVLHTLTTALGDRRINLTSARQAVARILALPR